MSRFRVECLLLIVIVSSTPADVGVAQGVFSCDDTPFDANSTPGVLRSRYHLVQIFGDVSQRRTNYFADEYNGLVAWSESRLLVPRLSTIISSSIPFPDPFLMSSLKGLRNIDWEDRWDYGAGIEWRPFMRAESLRRISGGWLNQLRFYGVFLGTHYLKYQDDWAWRPVDDNRYGVEIYRECNFYNRNRFWSELWTDASWRKTNFYVNDFENWVFSIVPRWGVKLFPGHSLALLPYLTGELSVTERKEFWQNRALLGGGIRVMPFRWEDGVLGMFLRGTKIYIEYGRVLAYLKDEAPENLPDYDVRFGVNYTINRW